MRPLEPQSGSPHVGTCVYTEAMLPLAQSVCHSHKALPLEDGMRHAPSPLPSYHKGKEETALLTNHLGDGAPFPHTLLPITHRYILAPPVLTQATLSPSRQTSPRLRKLN